MSQPVVHAAVETPPVIGNDWAPLVAAAPVPAPGEVVVVRLPTSGSAHVAGPDAVIVALAPGAELDDDSAAALAARARLAADDLPVMAVPAEAGTEADPDDLRGAGPNAWRAVHRGALAVTAATWSRAVEGLDEVVDLRQPAAALAQRGAVVVPVPQARVTLPAAAEPTLLARLEVARTVPAAREERAPTGRWYARPYVVVLLTGTEAALEAEVLAATLLDRVDALLSQTVEDLVVVLPQPPAGAAWGAAVRAAYDGHPRVVVADPPDLSEVPFRLSWPLRLRPGPYTVAGMVAAADARRAGLVRLVPESGDGVEVAVGTTGAPPGGGEPLEGTAALWRVGALARAGLDPLADGLEAVAAVDAVMGSWWLPAGSVSVTAPAQPTGPVSYGRADVPTRRRAAALAAQVARYEEQVAAAAEAAQQAAAARAELAALRRRARYTPWLRGR